MIIGAVLSRLMPDNYWVFPLIILSHYILDIIPHWEYLDLSLSIPKNFYKIVLDLVGGFILVYFFVGLSWWTMSGIFFALLPDLPILLYSFFKNNRFLKSYFKFGYILHHFRASVGWGIFSQILVIIIGIFISLRYL